jgi:single-strand DNA-binding protein
MVEKFATFALQHRKTGKIKILVKRGKKTEWHSVAIFSEPLVRIAEQYLRKGSKVYIEGQLETRKWQDQSGQDRYTTEVVLRPYSSTLTMLDSRGDSGSQGGYIGGSNDNNYPSATNENSSNLGKDTPSPTASQDFDDEIPF